MILGDLAGLETLYNDKSNGLCWPYVFSLPGWMEAWWRQFGADYKPLIFILHDDSGVLGVAPLKYRGDTASFIGDVSVCDYLDFVIVPGREEVFVAALLEACVAQGVACLDLQTLRPDSVTLQHVLPFANSRGFDAILAESDVSYEIALPGSFDAYLAGLDSRQRSDILRKRRRLGGLGADNFRMLEGQEVEGWDVEAFLGLMAESRRDKASFLTEEMRAYFFDITKAMAGNGCLRLGFLDIGAKTVAGVLGFDYNGTLYLYNSGYDPAYAELGVGLISKLEAIRWAIGRQKEVFDFMKGSEIYKERLGGKRVGLMASRVVLG